MMGDMKGKGIVCTIACILLIVGGLNWGLVGLLNLDLVALLFGKMPMLQKLVYILVGLSAVYAIFTWSRCRNQNK